MDKALVLPSNIVGISRACVVIAMMWLCKGSREELVKGFLFLGGEKHVKGGLCASKTGLSHEDGPVRR